MFLVENQIKFFAPEFFFASVLLFIVLQNSLIIDNKNYKNPLLVSITLQISSLTFLTFFSIIVFLFCFDHIY
jgi:hypothetical protein